MSDNKALERAKKTTTHKVRMPYDLAIKAMQTILDYANNTETDLVYVIAASMALDALKREAQPNDPLTLEELQNIRGCEEIGHHIWVRDFHIREPIAATVDFREDIGIHAVYSSGDPIYTEKNYGETWLAYRRKPDGGGE